LVIVSITMRLALALDLAWHALEKSRAPLMSE